MATVTELRNEAEEALQKAKHTLEQRAEAKTEDEKATLKTVYDRQWADYTAKKALYEDALEVEAAEKLVTTPANQLPKPSDLRNESDALIPNVPAQQANLDPSKFVQLDKGVIVPVATKDTEGYIKKFPVAVQHPSILARLGPELREEKAKQEEAFSAYLRRGYNWVARNRTELLPFLNALQEDDDSEGGYLVPTDQRTEIILDPGAAGGRFRARSRVFTTTRDGGTWPTMTEGGWGPIAEEAEGGEDDESFGQISFTIRKSGRNLRMSEEFLADEASNVVAAVGASFTRGSGRYEDSKAIVGNGASEPLGVRTTGAPQGNVPDITDLITNAGPTVLEIANAWAELPEQFRGEAEWAISSSFFGTLCAVESTNGGVSFIRELTQSPTKTLLGNPVFMFDGVGWDSGAGTIANGAEVGAFGDFRNNYFFIDRVGMSVRRDDSRYSERDQVLFKARKRYDSMFAIANAFRILKAAG